MAEIMNSFKTSRTTRTVDGGYLYCDVKVTHLQPHSGSRFTDHFREWLVEWPDGCLDDYKTLDECRRMIDLAIGKEEHNLVKGNH